MEAGKGSEVKRGRAGVIRRARAAVADVNPVPVPLRRAWYRGESTAAGLFALLTVPEDDGTWRAGDRERVIAALKARPDSTFRQIARHAGIRGTRRLLSVMSLAGEVEGEWFPPAGPWLWHVPGHEIPGHGTWARTAEENTH